MGEGSTDGARHTRSFPRARPVPGVGRARGRTRRGRRRRRARRGGPTRPGAGGGPRRDDQPVGRQLGRLLPVDDGQRRPPVRSEPQQPDLPAQRLHEAGGDAGPREVVEQVRDQHVEGRRRARGPAIDGELDHGVHRPDPHVRRSARRDARGRRRDLERSGDPHGRAARDGRGERVRTGELQADDVPPDRTPHELPLAVRQLHRIDRRFPSRRSGTPPPR